MPAGGRGECPGGSSEASGEPQIDSTRSFPSKKSSKFSERARYSTQLIEGNLGRKTPEKNTKKNFDPSPPSYFRENILAQIFAKLAIGSQNDYISQESDEDRYSCIRPQTRTHESPYVCLLSHRCLLAYCCCTPGITNMFRFTVKDTAIPSG